MVEVLQEDIPVAAEDFVLEPFIEENTALAAVLDAGIDRVIELFRDPSHLVAVRSCEGERHLETT